MLKHCCEKYVDKGFVISGYRQNLEEWICPKCGRIWVHFCDESEGCFWEPKFLKVKVTRWEVTHA